MGKKNQSSSSTKNKHRSPNPKSKSVDASAKRSQVVSKSPGKRFAPKKIQVNLVCFMLKNWVYIVRIACCNLFFARVTYGFYPRKLKKCLGT